MFQKNFDICIACTAPCLHGLSLQANVISCVSTSCHTSKSYCTFLLSALYSFVLKLNAIVCFPAEHFAEELC